MQKINKKLLLDIVVIALLLIIAILLFGSVNSHNQQRTAQRRAAVVEQDKLLAHPWKLSDKQRSVICARISSGQKLATPIKLPITCDIHIGRELDGEYTIDTNFDITIATNDRTLLAWSDKHNVNADQRAAFTFTNELNNIKLFDFNRDGNLDVVLLSEKIASNSKYEIYIYDTSRRMYPFDPSVTVDNYVYDQQAGTITANSIDEAGTQVVTVYTLVAGKFVEK